MKKHNLIYPRLALLGSVLGLVAACTTQSGPTYNAHAIVAPDQKAPTYRVECSGLLESSQTCFKVAAEICKDKPVTLVEAVDGVRSGVNTKNPREITFMCGNAIKFTATGDVLLEVYLKDDTAVDSPIVIGVSDTGIGMTPQQQETLFHAFTQADSSIARRYGGTGLGLALCLRLTELMHGTIWVKSELNAGSTFVVTLPIPVSAATPVSAAGHTKAESKSSEIDTHAIQILVVDDQLANRELLVAQLATLGYEADMADSGGAALRRFNERHYDLVLTDINMPGMDGYALARCLRAQSETLPIIAITAHVAAEERARCANAGIDEVLLKPVLLDTMDATARRLVDEAGRRPANATLARRDISQGPLPEHIHAAMTQTLKDSLRELHAAIELGDMKTVLAQLHAVRGSFAMIQETEAANACAQMEQQARNNDIAAVKDGLDRFEPLAYSALARRVIAVQSGA
ncbi:CheY-like chemotaxis protein [Paraburkholderia sp. JPY465]|uniref:Hpt domain-containing protein n=1 Tax=Paraburkholderia sp. JPY465 TaxID=3042285 RepID=UPI003D246D65